jgi:hypothetical protein
MSLIILSLGNKIDTIDIIQLFGYDVLVSLLQDICCFSYNEGFKIILDKVLACKNIIKHSSYDQSGSQNL